MHIFLYIPTIPSMVMNDPTTIKLSRNTLERLVKLGGKGDSYEDIILRYLPKRK